jgi:hypothetical protein
MVFLCTVNISLLLDELTPQNYFVFHYRAKTREGWGTESLKVPKECSTKVPSEGFLAVGALQFL